MIATYHGHDMQRNNHPAVTKTKEKQYFYCAPRRALSEDLYVTKHGQV